MNHTCHSTVFFDCWCNCGFHLFCVSHVRANVFSLSSCVLDAFHIYADGTSCFNFSNELIYFLRSWFFTFFNEHLHCGLFQFHLIFTDRLRPIRFIFQRGASQQNKITGLCFCKFHHTFRSHTSRTSAYQKNRFFA